MVARGVQNVPGDSAFVFFTSLCTLGPVCAGAVFSLTTEAKKEDQSSRVAPFF